MKILLVHKPISVLVNHVECFFELLDLGLIEHSKDIGSCALRALLRGLCLCPFA